MTRALDTLALALSAALLTAGAPAVAAGLADYDIDPQFRAKIAKMKAQQNAINAKNFNFASGLEQNDDCGSQNIGNVESNGRPGSGPREVFVFAPNAINLVSGAGCR